MNYLIRALKESERALLNDFLYEAIFIPEGMEAPPKSVLNAPELQVYIEAFGSRKDDCCFVAEVDGNVVGAVWVRVMNDYGHIGEGIPSFAISVYQPYRGYGLGTALMRRMLAELREKGYEKASLSVQKQNYAVKMYKKLGFEVIHENEEELIMACDLQRIV